MGQELGRALVNLGKPAEVIANEDVEPCHDSAEGQTEFNIPAQYCATQGTGGSEEGKEKTGSCSESVVLQTDDSKIAQILKRRESNKQDSATKHATHSDVTGYCHQESLLQKEVCITTDLLDLKGATSNCKAVQSEFVDESIKKNGAKELIKNNKSEGSTKNKVKRKRKLRSIVILKSEPVTKHRKEQEWNNWEEEWGKHKKRKSRSNSRSSGARDSSRRCSRKQSSNYQSHTTKYKENIHCRTPSSCREIQSRSHSDMCSRWSSSRSPELKTTNSRSQYTKDVKRERQGRDRDKKLRTEKESDRYRPYSVIENDHSREVPDNYYHLNLDEVHRKHRSHKRSFSGSDTVSSKNGGSLRCHRERYRKTGIRSVSTDHDFYAYESHNHDRVVRRRSSPEGSCFTVESSDCYESEQESGGKQNRTNQGFKSKRKRSFKVDRMSSDRMKADQVCYRLDAKVQKERKKQKMHKLNSVSQSKSMGSKYSSEIKSSPQLICKTKEKIQKKFKKHQTDKCFQKNKIIQAANVSFVGIDNTDSSSDNACARANSVESNPILNAMKSKPASLNASVTNVPVLGAMPPVPQVRPVPQVCPVPPPVLTKCHSSAFSPEDLNHLVGKLGIQVGSGSFGMEKKDSMLVDLPDNRKFYEVPEQKKHTLSKSFEDTKVMKVTNRASNQRPNMFDLQMQLLNLSQALSLALPPVTPLASKDPRNLQQDILHQLLRALTPSQRPRNPGISSWYKPLTDWDAPSPCSDELVSFSPPPPKDVDSCKEVNKVRDKQKKSSKEFGQQTSTKKNSISMKWENSDRLKKTVEAVKEVVLPLYSKKQITKDEYKQVMRVVVPKIFHCKTEFSRESIDSHVQICLPDVLAARSNLCRGTDS